MTLEVESRITARLLAEKSQNLQNCQKLHMMKEKLLQKVYKQTIYTCKAIQTKLVFVTTTILGDQIGKLESNHGKTTSTQKNKKNS